MMILLATFALVFFRALQQLNVVGGHYTAAIFTSYAIASAQVAVILLAVQHQWGSIPYMGTGGALGTVLAMFLHKRIIKWRNHKG